MQVMRTVKALTVEKGITACATIHSPTPFQFHQFDSILILLRGRQIYMGPNGAPLTPCHLHCIAMQAFPSFLLSASRRVVRASERQHCRTEYIQTSAV